ncbi:zinc finger C3HC-type protein 1 [Ambystoma mexicanum]|uniref:zinc finger C3HC-type protein 1 n=1 Tax=Ambystoma mexicanum TaxID=8296 RepID=UPI0037E7496C
MALPCADGERKDGSDGELKSPTVTPQKIRELISEGIAVEEQDLSEKNDSSNHPDSPKESSEADFLPCEKSSKEAFFSRLESFTSLKWAGKPHELSPLACAQYGWINIESDMLRCSSCQALLCMTLHPTFDFSQYAEKCRELRTALQTAHERFCFWPDSPCPERFWILLVKEPPIILTNFLERFESLCQLEMQLPFLKPEDLKNMALTEDTVSLLLQLIEVELEKKAGENKPAMKFTTDALQVHIAACILSLCGWSFSLSSGSMHLSIITCSLCMRKVGLWSFQQIESAGTVDLDTSFGVTSPPVEGRSEQRPTLMSISPPRRKSTRSRDAQLPQGTDQSDKSPSPLIMRMRSWDGSGGSSDRGDSDGVRSRPVTRSMGHGDSASLAQEVPASSPRRAKRQRFISSSSSDLSTPAATLCFNPLSQHRDWCPWVNVSEDVATCETTGSGDQLELARKAAPGWREVLTVLLDIGKANGALESDASTVPEKSRKVFRIFHQWQAMCSS